MFFSLFYSRRLLDPVLLLLLLCCEACGGAAWLMKYSRVHRSCCSPADKSKVPLMLRFLLYAVAQDYFGWLLCGWLGCVWRGGLLGERRRQHAPKWERRVGIWPKTPWNCPVCLESWFQKNAIHILIIQFNDLCIYRFLFPMQHWLEVTKSIAKQMKCK